MSRQAECLANWDAYVPRASGDEPRDNRAERRRV